MRSAPTASKAMPFAARCGATSTRISSGVRQPTAIQGLEGVKANQSPSPTTVIEARSRGSAARSSYAALIPPMPAPTTRILVMRASLI